VRGPELNVLLPSNLCRLKHLAYFLSSTGVSFPVFLSRSTLIVFICIHVGVYAFVISIFVALIPGDSTFHSNRQCFSYVCSRDGPKCNTCSLFDIPVSSGLVLRGISIEECSLKPISATLLSNCFRTHGQCKAESKLTWRDTKHFHGT
jgi:hypothetical protein